AAVTPAADIVTPAAETPSAREEASPRKGLFPRLTSWWSDRTKPATLGLSGPATPASNSVETPKLPETIGHISFISVEDTAKEEQIIAATLGAEAVAAMQQADDKATLHVATV